MNNARHPKRDPNQSRVSENMILLSVTKKQKQKNQNKTDNPPELLIMCHKRIHERPSNCLFRDPEASASIFFPVGDSL